MHVTLTWNSGIGNEEVSEVSSIFSVLAVDHFLQSRIIAPFSGLSTWLTFINCKQLYSLDMLVFALLAGY